MAKINTKKKASEASPAEDVVVKKDTNPRLTLKDAAQKASIILTDCPTALSFGAHLVEGVNRYGFMDMSQEAQEAREKIAVVLKECYNQNALSYGQIAAPLRTEALSIMALLDEQFQEDHGL